MGGISPFQNFSEEEKLLLLHSLKTLNQIVRANGILLKPSFQDFDRTNTCHITLQQFGRVMKQLGIMPSNDQVYELICRLYFDKGNAKEVNYVRFCLDVDKPEDMFPSFDPPQFRSKYEEDAKENTQGVDIMQNRFLKSSLDRASDPSDAEERLRAAVLMKRVRIDEFFKDFDKLRKGKVTPNQFRSVLSMLNCSGLQVFLNHKPFRKD